LGFHQVNNLEWVQEVHDKIIRVCIRWPDADTVLKNIRLRALKVLREEQVSEEELMHIKGMLTAATVNYQEFEEDFYPTLQKMSQL
jgi:hypothetical protein